MFNELKKKLQENFKEISQDINHLFEVNLDKQLLWEKYLSSFPLGSNEIYRERTEHDCSCCRQFIKNIGNVVVIKGNQIKTIWDFETNSTIYQPVVDALSLFVKSNITIGMDMYVSKFKKIGTDRNFEELIDGTAKEWSHFYLELDKKFVDTTGKSEGDIKGGYRDTKNVFKRSLDEISEESLLTVLELISQNSLYKGSEWKGVLTEFLKHKKEYDKLSNDIDKELYTWEKSVKVGGAIGRIKNHSIGTLLINVSEGMELDMAVRKYEVIVAPENYKRNNAIFTQKMLDDAKKTITELGYIDSLSRRYAVIDDLTINNILFSNKDSAKKIIGGNIFDEMSKSVAVNPKKFSKVEEVSIDNFIENILPNVNELDVFLENKHSNNMVSLIAPENKDADTMFKWNNGFSWAYSGNITDCSMKDRVKSAGGKVDGVLRFSIQWNDVEPHDGNDLDAHCIEPNGHQIYFSDKTNRSTTGELDIDITNPIKGKPAVENITWSNRSKMLEGTYRFFVRNFANRGGVNGFRAEIEYDGQLFSFDYNKEVKNKEDVVVAEVVFNKNTGFTITEKLPSTTSSRKVWNLDTNQFIPVSIVSYSPNYWDMQNGIGNRHYIFMLKDCLNPENPSGFFNEYLKEDLMKHRKVLEGLTSKMRVKDSNSQLSGIGFSSTQRNELIVKVSGTTERIIKIKI